MNTTRSANTYLLEAWDASNDSTPVTIPALLLVISILRRLLEWREYAEEGPDAKRGVVFVRIASHKAALHGRGEVHEHRVGVNPLNVST